MAYFGSALPEATPFFSDAMGFVAKGISNKRAKAAQDEKNSLASKAWMGDPQALQDLTALDPEMARDVEEQATQRKDKATQSGYQKDKLFKEDLETMMAQVSAFSDFQSAQSFGQRMTDMMSQKYPERWQEHGIPTEFDQRSFDEIQKIGGGLQGKPVGVPFRAVDENGNAVMAQQTQLKNGRTVTKFLTTEDGKIVKPAEYDAKLAYEKSFGSKSGSEQAVIDLADEKVLANLSAQAKADIMPARKSAEASLGMITALKNHPGLEYAVGVGWLNPGKYVPGTDAHNFMVLAEQASGKVFEQAYKTLKGGGQITEIESKKASQAIARMETSQSVSEYNAALSDFETAIRDGYDILLNQAQGNFETDVELPGRLDDSSQYTRNNPATPKSGADLADLKVGSYFKAPDGSIRVKKAKK